MSRRMGGSAFRFLRYLIDTKMKIMFRCGEVWLGGGFRGELGGWVGRW